MLQKKVKAAVAAVVIALSGAGYWAYNNVVVLLPSDQDQLSMAIVQMQMNAFQVGRLSCKNDT